MDRDIWRTSMPKSRVKREDGRLVSAFLLFALAVGLILLLLWLQSSDKADCENRGGVWLLRESACVSGPPGG